MAEGLAAALALAALAGGARAQDAAHFGPDGPPFLANEVQSFTQKQPKVACDPEGARFVAVWHSAAFGQDVIARVFDGAGAPLTGDIVVNDTLSSGVQDEPTVAMDAEGRFLVAWSDRAGYDGFQMGVFARAFAASGAPLGPEFRVAEQWQQSQWEPYAAARPGGGWVVGWTGNDSGRAYMRHFDAAGAPLTPEIHVAAGANLQQLDPVPAVAPDGTTFFAWIDFSGKAGSGQGTSIFGRLFDAAGAPLTGEFQVNTTNPGEQREPKTAADGLGRFVAVWEDRQADGSGIDIHARRYDAAGAPLGPEFQVNLTQEGDQVFPEVAADWVGNLLFVWEDRSGAEADVRARRFDAQGLPLGGELVIAGMLAGAQGFPDVACDRAGEDFVAVYTTPGAGTEIEVQRLRFDPLTPDGAAQAGGALPIAIDLPGGAGLYRLLLLSAGTSPGIALPDGRQMHLNLDAILAFVLAVPDGGGLFTGFTGPLDASARASATLALPANPALVGLTLQLAALTLDLSQTGLGQQLRHVTDPVALTVE